MRSCRRARTSTLAGPWLLVPLGRRAAALAVASTAFGSLELRAFECDQHVPDVDVGLAPVVTPALCWFHEVPIARSRCSRILRFPTMARTYWSGPRRSTRVVGTGVSARWTEANRWWRSMPTACSTICRCCVRSGPRAMVWSDRPCRMSTWRPAGGCAIGWTTPAWQQRSTGRPTWWVARPTPAPPSSSDPTPTPNRREGGSTGRSVSSPASKWRGRRPPTSEPATWRSTSSPGPTRKGPTPAVSAAPPSSEG